MHAPFLTGGQEDPVTASASTRPNSAASRQCTRYAGSVVESASSDAFQIRPIRNWTLSSKYTLWSRRRITSVLRFSVVVAPAVNRRCCTGAAVAKETTA